LLFRVHYRFLHIGIFFETVLATVMRKSAGSITDVSLEFHLTTAECRVTESLCYSRNTARWTKSRNLVILNVIYLRLNPTQFIFNPCSSPTARDQVSYAKEFTWRNSGLVFVRSYANAVRKKRDMETLLGLRCDAVLFKHHIDCMLRLP
jgi:hypothetical protein